MRKSVFLATVFLLVCRCLGAQEQQPVLVFDTQEWDFGTVDEANGPVTHTFSFRSLSPEPVQIDHVATSCGCTTVEYSADPVATGGSGYLTVVFDPARSEGFVMREVEVYTKNRKGYAHLSVSANVIPIPKGLSQLYPQQLVGTLRTNVLRCNFGYVAQGDSVTKVIRIANLGNRAVALSVLTTDSRYGMSVSCPASVAPQEIVNLHISYKIPVGKAYYGMTHDSVWVLADGMKSAEPVAVSAIGTDRFTDDKAGERPVLRVTPEYVDFGRQAPGRTCRRTISIANTGQTDLVLRHVATSEETTVSLGGGRVVKPGQSVRATVSATIPRLSQSRVTGSVFLTTNDPVRPFRELRWQAETK